MAYGLAITTAPTTDVVSLTLAKQHLRVDGTEQDALIQQYVNAAVAFVEGELDAQLAPATYTLKLDEFPEADDPIVLPRSPVTGVASVKYYDLAKTQQTLSSSTYVVSTTRQPGTITPAFGLVWPESYDQPDVVEVVFAAGFATIPPGIASAVLLLVGHWFENREAINIGNIVNEIPMAVQSLLAKHRTGWLA